MSEPTWLHRPAGWAPGVALWCATLVAVLAWPATSQARSTSYACEPAPEGARPDLEGDFTPRSARVRLGERELHLKRVRSGKDAVYISRADKAKLVLAGRVATWTEGEVSFTCQLRRP